MKSILDADQGRPSLHAELASEPLPSPWPRRPLRSICVCASSAAAATVTGRFPLHSLPVFPVRFRRFSAPPRSPRDGEPLDPGAATVAPGEGSQLARQQEATHAGQYAGQPQGEREWLGKKWKIFDNSNEERGDELEWSFGWSPLQVDRSLTRSLLLVSPFPAPVRAVRFPGVRRSSRYGAEGARHRSEDATAVCDDSDGSSRHAGSECALPAHEGGEQMEVQANSSLRHRSRECRRWNGADVRQHLSIPARRPHRTRVEHEQVESERSSAADVELTRDSPAIRQW